MTHVIGSPMVSTGPMVLNIPTGVVRHQHDAERPAARPGNGPAARSPLPTTAVTNEMLTRPRHGARKKDFAVLFEVLARMAGVRNDRRHEKQPGPRSRPRLLHMYADGRRLFEERVNDLYTRALMPGLAHLYIGEEAIAVGVCEALTRQDYITSTHRGHGHCLAKGASPDRMFAELLGKEAGYCKGKGGSMHIADPDTGNLGANAIVGGSAGIATGAAFSSKYLKTGHVAVCFFGEGALGRGLLCGDESAQLWMLPVIFVCENNFYNNTRSERRRATWAPGGGVRHRGGDPRRPECPAASTPSPRGRRAGARAAARGSCSAPIRPHVGDGRSTTGETEERVGGSGSVALHGEWLMANS